MSMLSDIATIVFPQSCVNDVYEHLRECGQQGVEGVALFAGSISGSTFIVKAAIIPQQYTSRSEEGLMYMVKGEELHRINMWLYHNKMSLVAQIHSHPNEAYHSEADDAYPIITTVGGISIVVPNFGFGLICKDDWAVYRLSENGDWNQQSRNQVKTLIKIVDNGVT